MRSNHGLSVIILIAMGEEALTTQHIPIRCVLIRDYWSGQLVIGIALAWFLIGGCALLGAVFIGYDTEAGSKLPSADVFVNLSVLSAIAAVAAWLRFRFVYRAFATGKKTKGKLVAVVGRNGSAKLRFEYVLENVTYTAVNRVLGGRAREAGEVVEVIYNPGNPSQAFVWDAYVPMESVTP